MTSRSLTSIALATLAICAGAVQAAGFANGGFEAGTAVADPPGGATFFAQGWLAAPTGFPAMWSTNARSGAHAALLTVPNGYGGSTMFQNSVDHGSLPELTDANVGDTPMLSFYAKGDVGSTGNVLFAMRYLAGNGAILGGSGNQFFQNQINPSTWSEITFQMGAIPTGTRALLLEMNTAVGPFEDARRNAIFIDDITVSGLTAPVPEPGTYALMLAGLAGLAAVARRRKAA